MKKLLLLAPLLISNLWAGGNGTTSFGVDRLSCAVGTSSIALTWIAPQNLDATGIRIERDGTQIAELDLSASTYTDTPTLPDLGVYDFEYTVHTYGGSEGDACPVRECSTSFLNGSTATEFVVLLALNGNTTDTANLSPFEPIVGNDAIAIGEVSYPDRPIGHPGQYAQFDEDESLAFGTVTPDDFKFGAETDFSISLLVKPDTLPDSRVIAGNKDTSNSLNPGWALSANPDGSWAWSIADGITEVNFQSESGLLHDDLWHIITAVHDRDGALTLYFDGQEVSSQSIARIGDIDNTLATGIATDGRLTSASFLGGIDELRIWRRRLIDRELKTLKNSLLPYVCPNNLECNINTVDTPDEVTLSWTLGSYIDLSSYEILRDGVVIATISADTTTYEDKVSPHGGNTFYSLRSLGTDAHLCVDLECTAPLRLRSLDGMVAHIKFNGDVFDFSAEGNHGTLNGTPSYTDGVINQSLSFDDRTETHEYVSLGTPDSLDFADSTNFTVSVWVKNDDGFPDRSHLGGSANDPAIIGNKNSRLDGNQGWHIGAGPNRRWQWSFSDGSENKFFRSGSNALSDGVWHHLLVVHDRDSGLATFYKNAQLVGSVDISEVGSISTSLPTAIATDGANASDTTSETARSPSWFHGEIDEVKIWNRAITPEEVVTVYEDDSGFMLWQKAETRFTAEELADSTISGPTADPDGDGIVNLLQYAQSNDSSTHPISASRVFTSGDEDYLQLTYRRRSGGFIFLGNSYEAAGLVYYVEETEDLAASTWTSGVTITEQVGDPIPASDADGFEDVTVRSFFPFSAAEQRYLRLRVDQR